MASLASTARELGSLARFATRSAAFAVTHGRGLKEAATMLRDEEEQLSKLHAVVSLKHFEAVAADVEQLTTDIATADFRSDYRYRRTPRARAAEVIYELYAVGCHRSQKVPT